jgi:hypothetical protein
MKLALVLTACCALLGASALRAASPPEPEKAGVQAETTARLFKPVPGKAVIYLVRDRGDLWTMNVPVYLDGREMGTTAPLSYFRWEVEPGQHVLVSGTTPPAVLEISTEAGGQYYVWQDINPGHQRAASDLKQVDWTTASQTISASVLLKNPE